MITIDSKSYRSPNHYARDMVKYGIKALVIHTGGGTKQTDLDELTKADASPVSSGYYVDRLGHVYCLVDDNRVAYHAGVSDYLGLTNWNNFSIGIETAHSKGQDWPAVQMQALRELCLLLITKYGIAQEMVVAHRWIAPLRKTDPEDWENAAFIAWIQNIYLDLDRQAWGNKAAYYANYRIPTAWRKHKIALGQALAEPILPIPNHINQRTMQFFAGGIVIYDPAIDRTSVYVLVESYKL